MESVNKAGHLMSLAALQQYDPYINKLLDVTGQVALYKFNSKANEWVRSYFCSAAAADIVIRTGAALANISQVMLHGCICLVPISVSISEVHRVRNNDWYSLCRALHLEFALFRI